MLEEIRQIVRPIKSPEHLYNIKNIIIGVSRYLVCGEVVSRLMNVMGLYGATSVTYHRIHRLIPEHSITAVIF